MSAVVKAVSADNAQAVREVTAYPCVGHNSIGQPVVLLHGWGADSRIWQRLPEALSQSADVVTLNLPGFAESAVLHDYSESSLVSWMRRLITSPSYLIGLSLGGMLCRAFAAQHPELVSGLITISTNSCFVSSRGHDKAMSQADFADFRHRWATDSGDCLRRFYALQTQGDKQQRQLLRQLRSAQTQIQPQAGAALLDLLGTLDSRSYLDNIRCPTLAIFGHCDALVPVATATALPNATEVVTIADAGHLPHLSNPQDVLRIMRDFFERQRHRLDKSAIATAFGRAAPRYDACASLQHRIGEDLLGSIDKRLKPDSILDLGCGTGYHSIQLQQCYPQARVIGVDISVAMLAYAKARYADLCWLCGDAENLAVQDQSQSLIFSNFTLQWCNNAHLVAAEIYRVLAAQGYCYLSIPGPRTLIELREAWAQVDKAVHVNYFASLGQWQRAFKKVGFKHVYLQTAEITERHQSVRELLLALKTIGAHNNHVGKSKYLTGKQPLQSLYKAYNQYRLDDGSIPASWDIISGYLIK